MSKTNAKTVSVEAKAKTVSVKKVVDNAKADEPIAIVSLDKLYSDSKSIYAAIEKAAFAGSTLQIEYQLIACSVIKHLNTHKDIRIVRHFLTTLPKSLRADSMGAFFDQYAAVAFDDKGEVHYSKEKTTKLNEAIKKPWWKAKKAEKYVPINLLKSLQRILDKAEKRLQEGVHEEKGDSLTQAQVESLKAIVIQLENNTLPDESAVA